LDFGSEISPPETQPFTFLIT